MASSTQTQSGQGSKSYVGTWIAILFLILTFVLGLLMFPPAFQAPEQDIEPAQGVLFIGRFHPIVVHLPVGALAVLVLIELACLRKSMEEKLGAAALFILFIGAAGSVAGVLVGIMLSREGGYDGGNFTLHQGIGIGATAGILMALVLRTMAMGSGHDGLRDAYRIVVLLSVASLGLGAHFGGNMTHGNKYLTEHAPPAIADKMVAFEKWMLSLVEEPQEPPVESPQQLASTPAPPMTAPPKTPPQPPPAPAPAQGSPTPQAPATEPAKPVAIQPGSSVTIAADDSKLVFQHVLLPVLEAKCNNCHNEQKSKGDLRMDTYELLIKGGEDAGKTVVPGKPDESLALTRVLLPLDDDEHMPPEGKDQMTNEEVSLLRWWIQEGASNTMKVKDAKFPAEAKSLVESLVSRDRSTPGRSPSVSLLRSALSAVAALALTINAADQPAPDPALAQAVAKVNASGASLMPISADAKAYRFTALNVAREFTDAGLAPLAPVADKIASLDLARTKITDSGLKAVAAMKNLKELHLENTAIGDAGLDHLKSLTELEYLNLYNTKVTDAGAQKLSGLAKLKSLYLWQTGVTKAGVAQLKQKLPGAHINIGWTAEDDAKPVAAAPAAAAAPAKAAAPPPAATAAAKPSTPAKPAATAPAAKLDPAIAAKAQIYKDVVAPILAEKCVSCHGLEKKKGKLQMHDFASLLKGGSDGPNTVVAGKPTDSLMMQRILLPVDDDEHMPPSDEKQITTEECQILSWWIQNGASETMTVAAAPKTPAIEGVLAALLAKGLPKAAAPAVAKAEKEKPKPLSDAEKKQIAETAAKMQALNASLMQLAQDTEQLRLSVINAADKFGDKELALLEPIAPHVVWVDLARSQVTDAGLAVIAKMTNLERLHLENTKATDAGIARLASLQKLEYLNLYGTKTTDAGLAKLEGAKGLKKVFVWQTGVTQAGAKALEGKLPGLKVNVGLTEAEIAKLTAPPPAPPPAPAAKKDEKKPEAAKPPPAAPKPAVTPPSPAAAKPKAPAPAGKPATPPAGKPATPPAATPPPPSAQPKKA